MNTNENTDPKNNLDAILFRLRELEEKAKEVDKLKKEISDIKEINSIGLDVADEIKKEQILNEVQKLNENDIVIPHLQRKAEELSFKPRGGNRGKLTRPIFESEIREAQSKTKTNSAAARKLGVSYPTYSKYCKMYGILKAYDRRSKKENVLPKNPRKGKYPIQKILNNEFPNFPIHRLKDKLIRSEIKKPECEQCGFKERRLTDGKIPLLLNFEDGNRKNHSLENLKILCYNCTFICGQGYIRKGTVHVNLDPDVMQGATFPIKARF
jgi:hypothetical protein